MYMDSPMAIYTENDGIVSLMHCEEWNFISFIGIEYSESSLKFTGWTDHGSNDLD